jgi:hypothetical protein
MTLLLASVSLPHHALAQQANCGAGVDTGGGQCMPMDAPGMPGYQGDRNQNRQPAQPQQSRAVWADRWGAIARDETSGDAGTIEGQDSKSKANQIAMGICQRNGSKHCQIVLSFYNQCAAVALGGKIINASGGATPHLAEETALSRCGGQSEQCKIVYSACSLPVRVQ